MYKEDNINVYNYLIFTLMRQWLSSPTSHFWKHRQLTNATFQRYGFSSTASSEPNDKESNQSAEHETKSTKANGDSTDPEQTQDTGFSPEFEHPEIQSI